MALAIRLRKKKIHFTHVLSKNFKGTEDTYVSYTSIRLHLLKLWECLL